MKAYSSNIDDYNSFINKLKEIVLKNFTNEQFGASDLVKQSGRSRSQLYRKLKSATGQSVSQFIREIRLIEALKLLQDGRYTASEVAYKVGFGSPTYFNTCFHEYFGFPPGETTNKISDYESKHFGISNSRATSQSFLKRNKVVFISIFLLIVLTIVHIIFLKPFSDNDEVLDKLPSTENSLAVLPIKNWSGDVELEYISDGMTDAIISHLAKIKSLSKVVPFTSIICYKDTEKPISSIANELDVNNILQGSFQLSKGQVKVSLQLLDGQSEKQIWSRDYTGDWQGNDMFEIQSEVAKNVAAIMTTEITESESE